jgi:hypothetical protein
MKIQDKFKTSIQFADFLEKWVRKYFDRVGYDMKYTFVKDLVLAECTTGEEGVMSTYNTLKKNYKNDYKALTELVMAINMLSWANDSLSRANFDGREGWINFYSNLYYESMNYFYDIYTGNKEACDYFFQTTD